MYSHLTVSLPFSQLLGLNNVGIVRLQVAESLLNPFGGDDVDFEINPLIEYNLQVRTHTDTETHRVNRSDSSNSSSQSCCCCCC